MRIAILDSGTRGMWAHALRKADEGGEAVAIAFDELDKSLKFKIGNGPWSPPARTVER